MRGYLNSLVITVVGLLVGAGLAFAYQFDRISGSTALTLGTLVVALCVTVAVFIRKMTHPDASLEQILYKTDHPTRP